MGDEKWARRLETRVASQVPSPHLQEFLVGRLVLALTIDCSEVGGRHLVGCLAG